MKLYTLLRKERILLNLASKKKKDVLAELVEPIAKGKDKEILVAALLKREELGSTGIGKGIAIPHGRSLVVNKLELVVGRSKEGVNFNAMDGKPVHLFFLIVAPPQDPGNLYLMTLGRIALVCQEVVKKKRYMEPETPEDFIKLIKDIEDRLKQ